MKQATVKLPSGEIWKDVVGYEGLYKISSIGRVKSFHTKAGRILKPFIHPDSGRALYGLYKNKVGKWRSAARLIAEAFIPNPENKATVNHINADKTDDRVENLEWMTLSENIKHGHNMGLFNNFSRSYMEKPVVQMDMGGNEIALFGSIKEAANKTGASKHCISMICNNKLSKWKKADGSTGYSKIQQSGGFKWRYADPTASLDSLAGSLGISKPFVILKLKDNDNT